MKNLNQYVPSVKNYALENLAFADKDFGFERYYANLSLCVIDAVFSIGVRYEAVTNTITRVGDHFDLKKLADGYKVKPGKRGQVSCQKFLDIVSSTKLTDQELAENIFKNRQRTSAKNGILKVSASLQFIRILDDFGVQYYQDVDKIQTNDAFWQAIKLIPGQSSGTSLKYFFMLAGDENIIKPDRMVLRFLQDATGILFKPDECQYLLSETAKHLKKDRIRVTPQQLDNLIWLFQREQKKTAA